MLSIPIFFNYCIVKYSFKKKGWEQVNTEIENRSKLVTVKKKKIEN